MTPLYTRELSQKLDNLAINALHIESLMNQAGEVAFQKIIQHFDSTKNWAVVCGGGHNGGDGYVIARLAHESGRKVQIFSIKPIEALPNDVKRVAEDAISKGVPHMEYDEQDFISSNADLIIDAYLGTGVNTTIRDTGCAIISAINQQPVPVVAIDIPSGLCADTGQPLGMAVKAALTITFIGIKQGLLTANGPDYCGHFEYAPLGVPQAIHHKITPSSVCLDLYTALKHLPKRKKNCHKGDFGHVLVIGGDKGMAGAALLAARAALTLGVGWVSVATHSDHASSLAGMCPDVMVHSIETPKDLTPLLKKATVIVLGVGMSDSSTWSKSLCKEGLKASCPIVIDGGACRTVGKHALASHHVITPHSGEAASMLNTTSDEIQADRFDAIDKLVEKYKCTTVLKGCGSLLHSPENDTSTLCPYGHPALAKAGSGDVLAGMISAFMAQGLSTFNASCLAVALHGKIGERLGGELGEMCVLASNIVAAIPSTLKNLSSWSASQIQAGSTHLSSVV